MTITMMITVMTTMMITVTATRRRCTRNSRVGLTCGTRLTPCRSLPQGMMESVGTPPLLRVGPETLTARSIPHTPDYTDPEIELILDEHADMHGNVYVHTPDSDDHKLVHHLDAENVTGSSFASPADDENRMTGTFYGDDHGTIVGTVNTAIVIGTYQAEKNGDDH